MTATAANTPDRSRLGRVRSNQVFIYCRQTQPSSSHRLRSRGASENGTAPPGFTSSSLLRRLHRLPRLRSLQHRLEHSATVCSLSATGRSSQTCQQERQPCGCPTGRHSETCHSKVDSRPQSHGQQNQLNNYDCRKNKTDRPFIFGAA